MSRKTSALGIWLALVGCWFGFGSDILAKVGELDRPRTVLVSVFNDANVPPGKVAHAETLASGVFARSGILLVWLNCSDPAESGEEQARCSGALFPEHLHIRIRTKSLNLSQSTFGVSFLGQDGSGCQADVFYSEMARLEQENAANSNFLLGLVMAHELGHLLLGQNSHSTAGLMQGAWDTKALVAASKGRLVFTEAESEHLRLVLDTKQPTVASNQ